LRPSSWRALRFEGRDQAAQPRPQFGDLERFVTRQPREIAEQLPESSQSARPRFLGAFPSVAPQRCDPVIEKRKACVRHAQQGEAQEAGDLDRPMRVLDPRQRRGLARHQPFGEMLQPCERQIGEDEPVRSQFLEKTDFLDLLLEAFGALARRHGAPSHSTWPISPPSTGASSRDTQVSRSAAGTAAAMVLNRACSWCRRAAITCRRMSRSRSRRY
jgi:hypothetical protein